jgi:GH25 family lysozyme M1 (1,4-beta-N-acetylmuramidase)
VSLFNSAARRTTRTLVVVLTSLAALAASSLAFADGIDVSHYQGSIDWAKVKASGKSFAFMKATEGSTYTDPMLKTNWAGAQAVGIYRGAYHFARPSTGTAVAQAKYFVSKVGSMKDAGTLPPVLDLEVTGGLGPAALRSWTTAWLTTVESLTGRTPILYCSSYFCQDQLGNGAAFAHYPLWIANYTTASAPRMPLGWSSWTFWQNTSSGSVSGISGPVDMNKFNGTGIQLATLANATGGTVNPVPAGPTVPTGAATALSMAPATTTAAINAAVLFAGTLTKTEDASPVPNAPVALWARSVGASTWSKVASGTTDTSGHYAVSAAVPSSSDFQAAYAGDTTYAAATSALARVTLPPRATVRVDLHKNKAYRVRQGAKVMIYGHTTTAAGALTGKYVRFYQRPARGGRWSFVRRPPSLAPTRWYSTNVYPRRSTTYKVVSFASLYCAPATSNTVTVWVR